MLFRSTEEVKAALGTVHQTLHFETLASFVPQAEVRYLAPYLGQELLDELDDALDANPVPTGPVGALLGHVRRALVYYLVLEAAPFLNVAFSDMGVMEQSAQGAQPARQWVYNKFEESTAANADTLLDTALFWLESKASAFPAWRNSEAYTVSRELFFHSTYDLSKFVNISQSRRTFLSLRPYMRRVEELEILPLVGQKSFDELKARLLSNTLSDTDKMLWQAIKPALAHRTMAEALPELAVQVSGGGVRVLADNDGIRERLAASPNQVAQLVSNHQRLATTYLAKLAQLTDQTRPQEEAPRTPRIKDNTGSKVFRV